MKKVLVAAIAAAAILTSCCGGGSMKTVSSLNNLTDSVSYAYGAFIGENIKTAFGSENEDLDVNVLAGAIKAAIEGNSITDQEINNAILQNYFSNIKPAKDKAVDTDFLAKVEKSNSKVLKTESGLLYEIIEEGDQSLKASGADTVMTIYTGTFSNGEEFDSTEKHGGEPAPFVLGQVIPGFSEGLQLIGKGGKIKLWIPAEIAYGDKLMIFDVEIADVKKAE